MSYQIKPQELRVGNILNWDSGEGIIQSPINAVDIHYCTTSPELFNKRHSPIPLSEDLLDRTPLWKHNGNGLCIEWCEVNQDGIITHIISYHFAGLYKGQFWWRGIRQIKYLHDLQNLYYAIECKELSLSNKGEN